MVERGIIIGDDASLTFPPEAAPPVVAEANVIVVAFVVSAVSVMDRRLSGTVVYIAIDLAPVFVCFVFVLCEGCVRNLCTFGFFRVWKKRGKNGKRGTLFYFGPLFASKEVLFGAHLSV